MDDHSDTAAYDYNVDPDFHVGDNDNNDNEDSDKAIRRSDKGDGLNFDDDVVADGHDNKHDDDANCDDSYNNENDDVDNNYCYCQILVRIM